MTSALENMGALLLGLAVWTFAEYAGHRWLMHGRGRRPLSKAHRLHHSNPDDLNLRGSVIYGTVALGGVALLAWAATAWVADWSVWVGIGVALGVLSYVLAHKLTHHWQDEPARLRSPWAAHLRHHESSAHTNFGFSTSLWDHLFGTYESPQVRRSQVRAEPPTNAQQQIGDDETTEAEAGR